MSDITDNLKELIEKLKTALEELRKLENNFRLSVLSERERSMVSCRTSDHNTPLLVNLATELSESILKIRCKYTLIEQDLHKVLYKEWSVSEEATNKIVSEIFINNSEKGEGE